ncbi:MAG TPA: hypothetical protein VFW33_06630, partial [Gemmataceae bacterium]|nr:hypothetical protein [Gemmataceae bacterium]
MSAEAIMGLTSDLWRLLGAGTRSAHGDRTLRQRAGEVGRLAAKVPALRPVADGLRRLTDATPSSAAVPFLDLLTRLRPVLAGLAATGLPGSPVPLAPSGPWSTPVAASELPPLVRWLERPSWDEKWMQTRGDLTRRADLRLVSPLLARLREGPADPGEFIAEQILPRYGPVIVPDLRRGLDWPDRRAQTRALGAICRIDGQAGAALCTSRLNGPDLKARQETLL